MNSGLSTTFLLLLLTMFGVVGTIAGNISRPGGWWDSSPPEGGNIAYPVFQFLIVILVMARVFQYNAFRCRNIAPTLLAFKAWWEANGGTTSWDGPAAPGP